MANINFTDLTRFTAASAGTGSFVVSAAVTGYQTPLTAGASNKNYHYRAESSDLSQWEYGTGTYTSSSVTLTRSPILNSAGGSSTINFTTAPQVAFVFLSEDFNATGQIPGTNTNDSATSGNIGEIVTSTLTSSLAVTLTSGATSNVTSVPLSAGDWDVSGMVNTAIGGGGCQILGILIGVSTTSALQPDPNTGAYFLSQITVAAGGNMAANVGPRQISLSSSASIYLTTLVNFSTAGTNSCGAYGNIRARRMR